MFKYPRLLFVAVHVLLFVAISGFFFVAIRGLPAEAAVLELRGPSSVAAGEQFLVEVYLDTEGRAINAVEGEINIIGRGFEVIDFEERNSIVSLWLLRPTLTGNIINFAGVIPGGFSGTLEPGKAGQQPAKIFGIIIEAKERGQLSIAAGLSRLTAHDGSGTLIDVVGANALVQVEQGVVAGVFEVADDNEPPEPFEARLVRSALIHEGKYSLVFQTKDNGSGVDYYEVKEGENEFKRAESPYLLEDQSLSGPIVVRALDRAGNEKLAAVDLRWLKSFSSDKIYWSLGLAALAIILFAFWRWKKASHNYYLFSRH